MVIDNSSFFRMDPDVPLIVPQVNPKDLKNVKKNIVANPNCSTAQMVIALKPLHDKFKIKRIVVSTYQSVSGAGKAPMDELLDQTRQVLDNKKAHAIMGVFGIPGWFQLKFTSHERRASGTIYRYCCQNLF